MSSSEDELSQPSVGARHADPMNGTELLQEDSDSAVTESSPALITGDGERPDSNAAEDSSTFRQGDLDRGRQELSSVYGDELDLRSRPESPLTPDGTLSVESSIKSPGKNFLSNAPGNSHLRPTNYHRASRSFDKRFTADIGKLRQSSASPASGAEHTRQESLAGRSDTEQDGDNRPPWDVVRWTRLKRISQEVFSETGKRNYGRATCIAVSSLIVVGTSKGLVLVFDYQQSLKSTIGLGTKALACGQVTAIALSADHSAIAAGYSDGSIFTWDVSRPAKPFLHLPPIQIPDSGETGPDGHVQGAGVLHIGFLGTRHTALVSADEKGMAFSHLASRGMGSISRSIHTTRLLGRYPDTSTLSENNKKPSSVLAFAAMPLGNVELGTDSLGLVAMLTPYLLVVVSTTPIAQTQHKASRPKELAPHGALSASLAWYPAMKQSKDGVESHNGNAKLAYAWLNVVTILELVETDTSDDAGRERPTELEFKFNKRWTTSESIVAMQWLSSSVLALFTITQQLLFLDTETSNITDSCDLLSRHVYHADYFSNQLSNLVESYDESNASMHGVIADAFYMSFRAYKGRLFLLGHDDLSIGTLSNWADRLLALMENGDFISAITLATAYFDDNKRQTSIGLPESIEDRQSLVREKLIEMMLASLNFALGGAPEVQTRMLIAGDLEKLATACFAACMVLKDNDFLFEVVFEFYADAGRQDIFYALLEPEILGGHISKIPPAALKRLVDDFAKAGRGARLEEMLCQLDPETMDLDRITTLCRHHGLYDALLYVWSQAIGDYVTSLATLLELANDSVDEEKPDGQRAEDKIYPYLTYILTGRVYPTGQDMSIDTATNAKLELYWFIFSDNSNASSKNVSSFTNLKTLISLDSLNFFSMLNEAFEDSFLNGHTSDSPDEDESVMPSEKIRFRSTLNRRYIVNTLRQEVTAPDYEDTDILHLDMFIARNIAKYPQFISLTGSASHKILTELCNYPHASMTEDCQLSLEYLLSVYRPPDSNSLIPLLLEAKFYRITESIYRSQNQYSQLLQTCFADVENKAALFECIRECLNPASGLSIQETNRVRAVVVDNASRLLDAGIVECASTIEQFCPELHVTMIKTLEDRGREKFDYLREVLEPLSSGKRIVSQKSHINDFVGTYAQLLCEYEPQHVRRFVSGLQTVELHLETILPLLEEHGAVDAVIVLMARGGQLRVAFEKLMFHFKKLSSAMDGLLARLEQSPDTASTRETAEDLLTSIEKYHGLGIWLCQLQSGLWAEVDERTRSRSTDTKSHGIPMSENLLDHEVLWLDLVDTVVLINRLSEGPGKQTSEETRHVDMIQDHSLKQDLIQSINLGGRLKQMVHTTFDALLVATSRPRVPGQTQPHSTFLRILRAFLSRASKSSASLSPLRDILRTVFSSYTYEEELLGLAYRLLDQDLYVQVEEIYSRRKQGWRPLGQHCGGCGQKVWGPGVGSGIWDAWSSSATANIDLARSKRIGPSSTAAKGKGRASGHEDEDHDEDNQNITSESSKDAAEELVIFSCRHIFHQRCLEPRIRLPLGNDSSDHEPLSTTGLYSCPLEFTSTT